MNNGDLERRRQRRVPVGMYLQQVAPGGTHRFFASNASENGLYMERPVGAYVRHSKDVQLEIPLPGQEDNPLWARAEVVYDSFDGLFHGTAVQFTDMAERDRARLGAWLRGLDTADPSLAPAQP